MLLQLQKTAVWAGYIIFVLSDVTTNRRAASTIMMVSSFINPISNKNSFPYRRSNRGDRNAGNNNNKPPTGSCGAGSNYWDDGGPNKGIHRSTFMTQSNNEENNNKVLDQLDRTVIDNNNNKDTMDWTKQMQCLKSETYYDNNTNKENDDASNIREDTNEKDSAFAVCQEELMTRAILCFSRGGGDDRRVIYNKSQAPAAKTAVSPLETAVTYWKKAISNAIEKAVEPFQNIPQKMSQALKPQKQKEEAELLEKLRTMPIQKVIVKPDSTVLPSDVVDIAARSTNMIGSPLRTNTVQDFAQTIKRWYNRNGYILHSVTGATLNADTGVAEIQVQEPTCAREPVGITFVKEMVIDDGELLTLRQYKEKHTARRSFGFISDGSNGGSSRIDKRELNTTFIETTGRVKSNRIASALQLQPGKPFQWERSRWSKIASCGIFQRIFQASPRPLQDGTVQFHIIATESPPRHLEYGVGKSLYTGVWEGEIDFEHTNLLGGGETIGISIKRQAPVPSSVTAVSTATTTKRNNKKNGDDALNDTDSTTTLASSTTVIPPPPAALSIQPSIRIKYSDGRLYADGGYDVEVFREYLGNSNSNLDNVYNEEAPSEKSILSKPPKDSRTSISGGNKFAWFKRRSLARGATRDTAVESPPVEDVVTTTDEPPINTESHYDIFAANAVANALVPDVDSEEVSNANALTTSPGVVDTNYENDMLYDRKGATVRFNNPIDPGLIRNTVASASIEQMTTINGYREAIGSTTWDIGPFVRELPLGARTNFDFSVTAGTRITKSQQQQQVTTPQEQDRKQANNNIDDESQSSLLAVKRGGFIGRPNSNPTKVLPYSSVTATARQIFPLLEGIRNKNKALSRPLLLAFRHSVIVSTPNLPRHTMQAHGTATTIRGTDRSCDPTGRVSSAVQGTVELRVPVQIPSLSIQRDPESKVGFRIVGPEKPLRANNNDGSVVLFSDWVVTTQDWKLKTVHHKSNVGIGLRKTIAGLPVQYDICYIPKGKKLKASFGLGKDFDF